MTEEQYHREMIAGLQREYQALIKPHLDRLYAMRALDPNPSWMVLDLATGKLGLLPEPLRSQALG